MIYVLKPFDSLASFIRNPSFFIIISFQVYETKFDSLLDGPGSNPGDYEIFRPSRLALEPTQLSVK
jgi:hypothetical protein